MTAYQKKILTKKVLKSFSISSITLSIVAISIIHQSPSNAFSTGAKVIPNDQAYSTGTFTNTIDNTTNVTLANQNTEIDNADNVANWTTSDASNTPITQETTVKQEGTGSVKITSSGAVDGGTGADGTLDLSLGGASGGCSGTGLSWSSPTCTIDTSVKNTFNFTTVNVSSGTTLRATGSSFVEIKTTSTVTVAGTVNLNASGQTAGAGGGNGGNGGAVNTIGTTGNGNGGGGGGPTDSNFSSAGCGGSFGGAGGRGGAISTACTTGSTYTTTNAGGSGGGGGGGNSGNIGGSGGGGGGSIVIYASGDINVTGSITANGGNASASLNFHVGGGGGGSGGRIDIQSAQSITGSGSVSANGGAGAGDNSSNLRGGGGGGGRITLIDNDGTTTLSTSVTGSGSSGSFGLTPGSAGVVTTTTLGAGPSVGSTVITTKSATDLSGHTFLTLWVRSDTTGTNFTFGYGESAISEHTTNITINSADTWEQKTIDISAVSPRNAITKFGLTVTNAFTTMYFDDIRASGYHFSGTYESAAIDAAGSGNIADFTTFSSSTTLPSGTSITFETATSANGSDFSAYQNISGGNIQSSNNRYIKVRISFTSSGTNTPTLTSFTVNYNYSALPTLSVLNIDQLSRSEDSSNAGKVKIDYNSSDADDAAVTISLEYFNQSSETYTPAASTSGDIGSTTPGSNKTIYWAAATDVSGVYWNNTKIRLTVSDGVNTVTSESPVYTLDTKTPTGATASSPTNGATNQNLSLTLTSISASDDTTSGLQYNIEYATDNTITTNVISSGFQTANTFEISGLDLGTTYYWRIKARDAFNNTLTSSVFSFTTASNAPDIYNLSASQGANGKVTITYDTSDGNSASLTATIYWYNGNSFEPATIISGDSGTISTGEGKSAIWDIATDFPLDATDDMRVKVTVSDGDNSDSEISDAFSVDTRAPICTGLTINDGAKKINSLDVTIKLYCDNTAAEMIVSNNSDYSPDGQNGNSGIWRTYQTPFSWKLANGPDGIRRVYVKVRNFSLGETILETVTSENNATNPNLEVDLTPPSTDISYFYIQRACSETFGDFFWDKAKPKPTDFAGYKLERRKSTESYSTAAQITSYDTMTFRDNGLTANENYFFRLTAYDQAGNTSSYKEITSFCTITPTPTATPTSTPTPTPRPSVSPSQNLPPTLSPSQQSPTATPTPASQYNWGIFGTPMCYPASQPIGSVTQLRISAPSEWYITTTASTDRPYATGGSGFKVLLAGIDPFGSSGIITLYSGTYPNGAVRGIVVFTHPTAQSCAEPTPTPIPSASPTQAPQDTNEQSDDQNPEDEEDILDELEWEIAGTTRCFPSYPNSTGGITVFSVAALTNWYVITSSNNTKPFAVGSEGIFNNLAVGIDPFGSSGIITLYSGFYPNGVQKDIMLYTTPNNLEECAPSSQADLSPTPTPTGTPRKQNITPDQETDPTFSFTRKRQKVDPITGQIFVDRTPPPVPDVSAQLIFNPEIILNNVGNIIKTINPFSNSSPGQN